jgi:iron complex outermembrane receptor protein
MKKSSTMPRLSPSSAALLACWAGAAFAQPAAPAASANAESEKNLPEVNVRAVPSPAQKVQTPASTESVTAAQINDTANVVNTEDAFRYLPNILIRKRHIGDTQAPMTTRTSGVGASARSLIYVDGMLVSAPIANDNNNGGPKWGMVNPEEIERIDIMYGPFSAAYAGNSIGAVAEITTRMPERFEANAKATGSWQNFNLYGTSQTYRSSQFSALLGNKVGDFSFWLGANHLDSYGQPLTYVTVPRFSSATGTRVSGAVPDANRNGGAIFVLGEGGIEHNLQDNFKFKAAYDFSPSWRLTYTGGVFQNNTTGRINTYLANAAGTPFYGNGTVINQGGFSSANAALNGTATVANTAFDSGMYKFNELHSMHNLSLKSNMRGNWDWEVTATRYNYDESLKRTPSGALPAAFSGGVGTLQDMKGTGWGGVDARGFWRPQGAGGAHSVSFGYHYDRAILSQATWNTGDWIGGTPTTLSADSRGKTETQALWMQDVWKFAPGWRATVGGRAEQWRAYDGRNLAGAVNAIQPGLSASTFSPKGSVAWDIASQWVVSASYGQAYRFPTVTELYRSVTVSGVTSIPNPNLKPENAMTGELAIERALPDGRVRLSLFQEDVRNALISQSTVVPGGTTNVVNNVDMTRSRGVEVVYNQDNVFIRGLEMTGSLTYVDARIASDALYQTAVGKLVPQVPTWRATAVVTYRPSEKIAATLAARYQGRMYGSIENWDGYGHTYQGFEGFFVADARIRYKMDRNWTAALGVDNLNNNKYFLFHPFPQRTVTAELKYTY